MTERECKMAKTRTVEIEDVLQECVDDAVEELEQLLREYLKENPDLDETPDLSNNLDYDGRFHEIVDSNVPIYTSTIEDTWYLHSNELEGAYESAGIGDNPRENDGMVAIYCYIEQEAAKWYLDNAEEIFDAFKEQQEENDN